MIELLGLITIVPIAFLFLRKKAKKTTKVQRWIIGIIALIGISACIIEVSAVSDPDALNWETLFYTHERGDEFVTVQLTGYCSKSPLDVIPNEIYYWDMSSPYLTGATGEFWSIPSLIDYDKGWWTGIGGDSGELFYSNFVTYTNSPTFPRTGGGNTYNFHFVLLAKSYYIYFDNITTGSLSATMSYRYEPTGTTSVFSDSDNIGVSGYSLKPIISLNSEYYNTANTRIEIYTGDEWNEMSYGDLVLNDWNYKARIYDIETNSLIFEDNNYFNFTVWREIEIDSVKLTNNAGENINFTISEELTNYPNGTYSDTADSISLTNGTYSGALTNYDDDDGSVVEFESDSAYLGYTKDFIVTDFGDASEWSGDGSLNQWTFIGSGARYEANDYGEVTEYFSTTGAGDDGKIEQYLFPNSSMIPTNYSTSDIVVGFRLSIRWSTWGYLTDYLDIKIHIDGTNSSVYSHYHTSSGSARTKHIYVDLEDIFSKNFTIGEFYDDSNFIEIEKNGDALCYIYYASMPQLTVIGSHDGTYATYDGYGDVQYGMRDSKNNRCNADGGTLELHTTSDFSTHYEHHYDGTVTTYVYGDSTDDGQSDVWELPDVSEWDNDGGSVDQLEWSTPKYSLAGGLDLLSDTNLERYKILNILIDSRVWSDSYTNNYYQMRLTDGSLTSTYVDYKASTNSFWVERDYETSGLPDWSLADYNDLSIQCRVQTTSGYQVRIDDPTIERIEWVYLTEDSQNHVISGYTEFNYTTIGTNNITARSQITGINLDYRFYSNITQNISVYAYDWTNTEWDILDTTSPTTETAYSNTSLDYNYFKNDMDDLLFRFSVNGTNTTAGFETYFDLLTLSVNYTDSINTYITYNNNYTRLLSPYTYSYTNLSDSGSYVGFFYDIYGNALGNESFTFTDYYEFDYTPPQTRQCFVSIADQQGEYLEFANYKTRIDGSLIYDPIFLREINEVINITIYDRFDQQVTSINHTVDRDDNWINLQITLHTIKIFNMQQQFAYFNITKFPVTPIYWSEWVAPTEITPFRLYEGNYVINITEYETRTSELFYYNLTADDILMITSENTLTSIANISNSIMTLTTYLTQLYQSAIFSGLLNWTDIARDYGFIENYIDTWTFENLYKNDTVQLEFYFEGVYESIYLAPQERVSHILPKENVNYRVINEVTNEVIKDWDALENATIKLDFGFYEDDVSISDITVEYNDFLYVLLTGGLFLLGFVILVIIVKRAKAKQIDRGRKRKRPQKGMLERIRIEDF